MLLRSQPAAHLSKKLHRVERILAADTSVPSGHTRTHTSAQMSISSSLPHFRAAHLPGAGYSFSRSHSEFSFRGLCQLRETKRQADKPGDHRQGNGQHGRGLDPGNGAGGPARPARLQRHNWQRARKGEDMDRGWGPANTGGVHAGSGYSEEMGAARRAVSLGNRGIYGAGRSDRRHGGRPGLGAGYRRGCPGGRPRRGDCAVRAVTESEHGEQRRAAGQDENPDALRAGNDGRQSGRSLQEGGRKPAGRSRRGGTRKILAARPAPTRRNWRAHTRSSTGVHRDSAWTAMNSLSGARTGGGT